MEVEISLRQINWIATLIGCSLVDFLVYHIRTVSTIIVTAMYVNTRIKIYPDNSVI